MNLSANLQINHRTSFLLNYLWTYLEVSLIIRGVHATKHVCTWHHHLSFLFGHKLTLSLLQLYWWVHCKWFYFRLRFSTLLLVKSLYLGTIAEFILESNGLLEHASIFRHVKSKVALTVFNIGLRRIVKMSRVAIYRIRLICLLWQTRNIHFRFNYEVTGKYQIIEEVKNLSFDPFLWFYLEKVS